MKNLTTDNFPSRAIHVNRKSQKKTDKSEPTNSTKVERLFLHIVGISPVYLTVAEAESELRNKYGGQRQTYVYDILNQLTPKFDQFPYRLLMKQGDFFDREGNVRNQSERKEGFRGGIMHNVLDSYGHVFDWKYDIKHENEFDYGEELDIGSKKIIITIRKKTDTINSIEIIVDNVRNEKAKAEKINFASIRLHKGQQEGLVPLYFKRSKGTVLTYSIKPLEHIHLYQYLDKILLKPDIHNNSTSAYNNIYEIISIISENDPKKIKYKYHLNIRGLLRYILLCSESKKMLNEIEKVIQNLSEIDTYVDIIDEFNKYDLVFLRINKTNDKTDVQMKKPYNFQIKERFPFLSYYNEYKNCLPEGFAPSVLLEIARGFVNRLEKLDVFDLKYEVTSLFLHHIEEYFWQDNGFLFRPRVESIRLISDDIFHNLVKFQTEIRIYLRMRKEKELESFNKLTKSYNRDNNDNLASRKNSK